MNTNDQQKKRPRIKPIPLEFLILNKILWAFRHRQRDRWTICSKSDITRRFLYRRQKEPLTPQAFYHLVLPGWIRRGLACEIPRPGKPPAFAFRPMTLAEINGRLKEIDDLELKNRAAYENPILPEYRRADVAVAINRLRNEARALRLDRSARLDEQVNAAVKNQPQ